MCKRGVAVEEMGVGAGGGGGGERVVVGGGSLLLAFNISLSEGACGDVCAR